ncbi:ankyrin repeat-containing domain protein [Nemania sp. FL0916]|nr:ankyrin repeat-containing domain protein [Nemania sp. FL0916]
MPSLKKSRSGISSRIKPRLRRIISSRRRKDDREQRSETETNTSGNETTNFRIPSPLSESSIIQTELVNNHTTQTPHAIEQRLLDTPIQELWNLAYEKLHEEDAGLISDYQARLSSAGLGFVPNSEDNLAEFMDTVLQHRMNEVNRDKWKLKFGYTEIQARDIVPIVLGIVDRINDFVTRAVSANPSASLAWAGVSLLLQLFSNPSEQNLALAKGLEYISSIVVRSWIWEDLYARRYQPGDSKLRLSQKSHAAYKCSLEALYRQILKFQVTSYCYYASKTASRVGKDIIKWNEWNELLDGIKDKEGAFIEVCVSWRDMKYDEECLAADERHRVAISHWQSIETEISRVRVAAERVQEVKAEKECDDLLDWICPIDPSAILNSALDKLESGTCQWLIDGDSFNTWKESPSSLLWLHGKAGSGKSILTSSVIRHLKDRSLSNPEIAYAYFFFSFSDPEKQKVDVMLASLIKQLYASRPNTPQLIKDLRRYQKRGERPDTKTLETVLAAAASGFSSVFIVIDALDECPTLNRERSKLLSCLNRVIATMPHNHHIFCTSRPEQDLSVAISAILSPPSRVAIDLTANSSGISQDIGLYIESSFASASYGSWPEYLKAEAKTLLLKRADGMFQYVYHQLEVLRDLSAVPMIRTALQKLPIGLDATYDRLLRCIDVNFQVQVSNILKWLAFSNRTLRLDELAEIFILRPEHTVVFDQDERLFESRDCLKYLPGLIIVDETAGDVYNRRFPEVRLAHFSIKEYLTSSRVDRDLAAVFSFTDAQAHLHIAHSCLAHHLYRCTAGEKAGNSPLESYATKNWMLHLNMVPRNMWSADTVRLVIRALAVNSQSLRSNLEYNHDLSSQDRWHFLRKPLSYTARLGFLEFTHLLLRNDLGTHRYLTQWDLDGALLQAAYRGSMTVVELLLNKGANANATSDKLGQALSLAASRGHTDIVELLLDRGVDVNAQHYRWGSALEAAAFSGHLRILRLLMSRGADVNMPSHTRSCALTSVVSNDRYWESEDNMIECLRFLLDKGAEIDHQGSSEGTALYMACARFRKECIHLLLERGANVNARSGDLGFPLQALCKNLNPHSDAESMIKLLLDHGADVNAQGGRYGNALQAICMTEQVFHKTIIELLLEKGADINIQGGELGTALQAACAACRYWEKSANETMKLLLERGADVNIQGGRYGNALQAACYAEYLEGVQLLLQHGANVNALGGRFGNALQAACFRNNEEIARLLLDHGANVNASGGEFGSALIAAATVGYSDTDLLELLFSKGADIKTNIGRYGTALQGACTWDGYIIKKVNWLLDHGADINAKGGQHGTALQAAYWPASRHSLPPLLIRRGANVHLQAGEFGSAWHTAAAAVASRSDGRQEIFQLLLEQGVDINDKQGGQRATALQVVIEGGYRHDDLIRFLVDNGADINTGAGIYGFPLQSACVAPGDGWQAKFLLENYPDINVNAVGGLFGSALQAAAYFGKTKTVELLLQKGADVNVRGGKYGSALNAAIFRGFWNIVEMLLENRAIPDCQLLVDVDDEWLKRVQEEFEEESWEGYNEYWGDALKQFGLMTKGGGEEAVARYRVFWEAADK